MDTTAIVMMVLILGTVWGGLLLLIATAWRLEAKKRLDAPEST